MQSSPAASHDAPSTKAALDHLHLLIEHLLRENRHLKLSLQQTRAHLDEVRAHLNRFKLEVAEHDRNDRLIQKQIRTMATLIERHRDANSPPSSPEPRPTPPPSSVSKSPPSPNPPLHTHLRTDVANTSQLASVPETAPTRSAPALPDVNGNRSGTSSISHPDNVPCTDSPTVCTENIPKLDSRRTANTRGVRLNSQSPPGESSTEKASSPGTAVSDALQKAFVAMEKDTTNTVQVLHDAKGPVPCQSTTAVERRVEEVRHLCLGKDTARDANVPDANGIQRDGPQQKLKKQPGSSRQRSLKALKRKVAGTSPASDSAVLTSRKRSLATGVNGRLRRSSAQSQSSRSPSQSANHLAKNVALKKTKKGYKVSLGLSRNSSKSGDSSSSSSDSDSGSSGPGCSASFSGPLRRPAKAQVSMETGMSDLIGAARKLKKNLGQRKKGHEKPNHGSDGDTESGWKLSESHSNHADMENNAADGGIENGSFVPGAAIASTAAALYAMGQSEDGLGSFPDASGSPQLGGSIRGGEKRLQGDVTMNQNHTNDRTTRQHPGQSNPFSYGKTSNFDSIQYTSGTPHNPVPESARAFTSPGPGHFGGQSTNGIHPTAVENHPQAALRHLPTQSYEYHSLAAGKATKNDLVENAADRENAATHETNHVHLMPRSFAADNMRDSATSSSAVKETPGDTMAFLTLHSHNPEMLAWKAHPGSKYVDVSKGALAVKNPAAVSLEDGKVVMNGKMRVLKPVRMISDSTKYCYVSPMYPDGTFLPYVPVSGVVLHGKPVHWDSSQYADESVQLSFSKQVFDTLVSYTRRAYRKRHPGAQVSFPGAFLSGHRVRKVVRIEPDCLVNMTRLHKTASKRSVAETLAAVKKDVVGLVLLYISIEVRSEDCLSVEVIFGLRSMVAYGVSAERRR